MTTTWLYRFDQIADAEQQLDGDWDAVLGRLGGKGANLGDMTRLGIPVPPGFTITTEACNAYSDADGSHAGWSLGPGRSAMEDLENATGKRFGDPTRRSARGMPVGSQVLHARHDGHRPGHRAQR